MARRTLHSVTWSDGWKEDRVCFIPDEMTPCFQLQLDSLEQHLVHLAARRVYYAIAETGPLCQYQDSNGYRRFLAS